MGHYLKSERTGKFHYNPTIKRSTLLRDYERTTPIRPKIAGKRRRTWQKKKPKPVKYRRVSYGWSAGPDYGDYRVTKYVEEDQDPTISRGRAEKLLREGSDDPYNEWPYWSRGVKDYKSAVWATEDEIVDESELPTGYKLGEWRYELYRGKGKKSSW